MICPHCGKENPNNSVFCENCNACILESLYNVPEATGIDEASETPAQTEASARKRKKLLAGVIGGFALVTVLCIVLFSIILDSGYIESKGEIFVYNGEVSDSIIYKDSITEFEGQLYYISASLDGNTAAFGKENGEIIVIQNGDVTTLSADLYDFCLSANGTYFSFSKKASTIYLYNVRSGKSERIAENVNAINTAISPDGRSVAYIEYDSGADQYKLWLYNGKLSIVDVTDKGMDLIGISNNGKYIYVLINGELVCYNKNGNANSLGTSNPYSHPEITCAYGFNAEHTQILFYRDGHTYLSDRGGDPVEICPELIIPITPPNTNEVIEVRTGRVATYPANNLYNRVYIQAHKEERPSSIISGTISFTTGYTAWYVPKNGTAKKLVDCSEEPVLDNNGKNLYYLSGGDLYTLKPSYGKNAAAFAKKIADSVISYVVTSDRSKVYYNSFDGNLYSCNGKNGSSVCAIAQVNPNTMLYLNHADVLYFVMDGTAYACSNGETVHAMATDVQGCISTPCGYVYVLSKDTLYVSYHSRDLKKIWDIT